MKKVLFVWMAAVALLANGCYKDDIDGLKGEVDKLKQEQQTQAEQMQTLLNALDKKLTVVSVTPTDNGTQIVFSDGSSVDLGTAIVKVEELNGEVFFTLSNGTVIRMHKIETVALYILSEGSWGSSNSDLAYYDMAAGTLATKYYTTQNGSPLGDTGNDLKLYGSKMYCAVSGTDMATGGSIKVIDPKTGKLVKSIAATGAGGEPDMPRHIAVAGGKVYFTMYSGSVVRVDTTTLEITGRAALSGTFPEGICTYGDNLYVCNSGQGPGNTISVINTTSFTETATITVPNNPSMIEATATGDIYFTTADDTWRGGNKSDLHKFNAANTQAITTFGIRASRLAIGSDYVYTIDAYTDWSTFESETYLKKVNLKTGKASDFVTDGTGEDIMMGYNVSINPTNGDLYFLNQGNDVYVYDRDGTQTGTYKTKTGFGSCVVFINK